MSPGDRLPSRKPVYDLVDDTIVAPPMPGEVVVAPDLDRLIDKLAADLVIHAENCVREFGDFHLVLTGGNRPLPIYERLMYDPNYRRLPWKRTHLWLTSESSASDVPAFNAISETIADHADIPPEQVHPIGVIAADAAAEYETELKEALSWREKGQDRLDYVLLAPDAHGRAPGLAAPPMQLPANQSSGRFVCTEPGSPDKPGTRTVALTTTFLNSARFIAVLVTGDEYVALVDRISGGKDAPILQIHPLDGELKWYMDKSAIPDHS